MYRDAVSKRSIISFRYIYRARKKIYVHILSVAFSFLLKSQVRRSVSLTGSTSKKGIVTLFCSDLIRSVIDCLDYAMRFDFITFKLLYRAAWQCYRIEDFCSPIGPCGKIIGMIRAWMQPVVISHTRAHLTAASVRIRRAFSIVTRVAYTMLARDTGGLPGIPRQPIHQAVPGNFRTQVRGLQADLPAQYRR